MNRAFDHILVTKDSIPQPIFPGRLAMKLLCLGIKIILEKEEGGEFMSGSGCYFSISQIDNIIERIHVWMTFFNFSNSQYYIEK